MKEDLIRILESSVQRFTSYSKKINVLLRDELKKTSTNPLLNMAVKYELVGSISNLLQTHTRGFEKILNNINELKLPKELKKEEPKKKIIGVYKAPPVSKTERRKQKITELIREIRIKIKNLVVDSKIDTTQSMIKLYDVSFPQGSSDKVFIGEHKPSRPSDSFNFDRIRHGIGVISEGRRLYSGNWENNKKHGFGIQVYEDGKIFSGNFYRGEPTLGRWAFNDQDVFYGIFRETGNPETEWKLGLMEEDYKKIKKIEAFFSKVKAPTDYELKQRNIDKRLIKVKNILYYQNKMTNLNNVYMKDDDAKRLNMRALTGKDPLAVEQINFLNRVCYEGNWKNFKPNLLGEVWISGKREESIKILSRFGRILAYDRIEKFGYAGDYKGFETDREVVRKISQGDGLRTFKITFIDGTTYKGGVNQYLEFNGYGVLRYPGDPKSKFEDRKKERVYAGLFTPDLGFTLKFSVGTQNKLAKVNAYEFFNDSENYLERNKHLMEELEWIKIIDQKNENNKFELSIKWTQFRPEKMGMIKFKGKNYSKKLDNKVVTDCWHDEGILFNVLNYSRVLYRKRIIDEFSLDEVFHINLSKGNQLKIKREDR